MSEAANASPAAKPTPDADAFRRAGLTMAEARRRAAVARWRDETQSPWEASIPGVALWLVWRFFFKGLQPAWMLASLAALAWFGAQWLSAAGGIAAVSDPQPDRNERLGTVIRPHLPLGADARRFWNAQMVAALDGDRRRRPDIDRFRSWAALGPDLVGRERLALETLAGPAGPAALDARLRAGPDWERRHALQDAFAAELARGEDVDLQPPQLAFADLAVVQRQSVSLFQWSVAHASAEMFFRGDHRGQFEMRSLSGLVADGARDTRLYGGVRHLVMQACARGGAGIAACAEPIIPREAPDDVRYALAALEAGLVRLQLPASLSQSGAEVLQAARQAGRLTPALEAELTARLPALIPPSLLDAWLADSPEDMGLAFANPGRARLAMHAAIDLRTHPDAVAVSELLREIAMVRRETSAITAIRVMPAIGTVGDAAAMHQTARVAGPALLALVELTGRDAFTVLEAPEAVSLPGPDPHVRKGLSLAGLSAIIVLLLTVIRLATPRQIRDASRLSYLDAAVSRLCLGRKI